jgi:tetratricopeptide (TPR) repeat protein
LNENASISTHDERLRQLCLACNRGQLAAAELALHEWHRQGDCPSGAYVLLAACLSRREKYDDAVAVLNQAQRARPVTDPAVLMVMVCVMNLLEMQEASTKHLRLLHARFGHLPYVAQWIKGMNLVGKNQLPDESDAIISQLARELSDQPQLLASLAAAMKIEPDESHIDVLRHAGNLMINRIHLSIELETELCRALADLALLAEDEADARRWAHRGLKTNPLAAHLAIVLSQVDDQSLMGPPARDVLAKVNEVKPTYPDVHAALIRREFFDGDTQSARMRLTSWLKQEPTNPTAVKLYKELAA